MHISITKSGVSPKVAIERVQSKARFGYAEREQARASLMVIRLAYLSFPAPSDSPDLRPAIASQTCVLASPPPTPTHPKKGLSAP